MLIDYHDCQQSMGEAMGFDCSYHIKRREELGRVKATLEAAIVLPKLNIS